MVSEDELRKRGWTKTMIQNLLGQADAEGSNPHHNARAPMKFWEIKRVAAAEQSARFRELRLSANNRSAKAKAIAAQRAIDLLDWARNVKIEWIQAPVTEEDAMAKAVLSWQRRNGRRAEGIGLETVKRWARNYARHECMTYDNILNATSRKPGVNEAYAIIRARCERMFQERFPRLA